MLKGCQACHYNFETAHEPVDAAIGIAFDGYVGVRLNQIHGPFVVECLRRRASRPFLGTVRDRNGNAIGGEVEIVEGLRVRLHATLALKGYAAVFRSGPLLDIRCDVYVPGLGIKLPFRDAAKYLGTARSYDLIFEDGRVEGRLFGNPCHPSMQAIRIAEGLA